MQYNITCNDILTNTQVSTPGRLISNYRLPMTHLHPCIQKPYPVVPTHDSLVHSVVVSHFCSHAKIKLDQFQFTTQH